MAKIHIPKSEETLKKEQAKEKLKMLKEKEKVTNEDLRDLLIDIMEVLTND